MGIRYKPNITVYFGEEECAISAGSVHAHISPMEPTQTSPPRSATSSRPQPSLFKLILCPLFPEFSLATVSAQ